MAATDGSDVPRDPAAYCPSNHFDQRFRDPERHLDGDIISTVIETGDVTHRQADKFHLEADIDGVTYRLAIDPDANEVITAFPHSVDESTARSSTRWTDTQIDDILDFIESYTPRY